MEILNREDQSRGGTGLGDRPDHAGGRRETGVRPPKVRGCCQGQQSSFLEAREMLTRKGTGAIVLNRGLRERLRECPGHLDR